MKVSQARKLSLAALAACMAGTSATAQGVSFGALAVNLECLGAEFYSWAAFGMGLSEDLRAGGPLSVGGRKALLSPVLQDIVEEMAEEKAAHIRYLRNVLGDAAPPCPAMDIGPAFVAAADAAVGMTLDPPFDPYADDTLFLHGAFLLQDIFATAYVGGSESGMAEAAAMLASSESYFAGSIRVLLFLKAKARVPTPYGPIPDVVDAISDVRDALDGPMDIDEGIGSVSRNDSMANILPAAASGLPYGRTAEQVLAILFLGGEGSGGFFPEGVTGMTGMTGMTPEEMPEMMPEEIPEMMPEEIPDMMPEETPEMTPEETPEETPAETPEETPAELIAEPEIMFEVPEPVASASGGASAGAAGMCTGTCEYRVTGDMVWSAATHPVDYPSGLAHWSPFYVVTHDDTYFLWRFGETAAPAIQEIAETGAGGNFFAEVEACGDACSEGAAFMCNPFSGTCTASGTVMVTPDRPYISIASMVAPSPDWFTGVDAWPLCVDGEWIDGRDADVDPYDAGTDSGPSFQSPDEVTSPFEPVFNFRDTVPLSDSIFYNPSLGEMLTVGNIAVELVGCS